MSKEWGRSGFELLADLLEERAKRREAMDPRMMEKMEQRANSYYAAGHPDLEMAVPDVTLENRINDVRGMILSAHAILNRLELVPMASELEKVKQDVGCRRSVDECAEGLKRLLDRLEDLTRQIGHL